MKTMSTETTESDLFQKGDRVTVTGVKTRKELNGKSGSVVGRALTNSYRFEVLIDGHSRGVYVKIEILLPESCPYESDSDDFDYSDCDNDVNLAKAYRKIAESMKEIDYLKRERHGLLSELVAVKHSMKKEKPLATERSEKLEQHVKDAEKKARIAVMKKRDAEILVDRFSLGSS